MVKVSIKLDSVKKKLSQEAVNRGRYAFANQAMADMNQFVPMLSTALRGSVSVDNDGKGITYDTNRRILHD